MAVFVFASAPCFGFAPESGLADMCLIRAKTSRALPVLLWGVKRWVPLFFAIVCGAATCSFETVVTRSGMPLGDEAAEWDIRVLEAQQAVNMQASAMAGAYGNLLNVTTDDILWGMGQVTVQLTLACVC